MALPRVVPHPACPGLHLRRLRPDDATAFHAAVTDPAVGRMLAVFPADWPLAKARELMAEHAAAESVPARVAVAAEDGQFLGSIARAGAGGDELSCFLTPEAQGQRIMRPASEAFVAMVFAVSNLPTLRASVYHVRPEQSVQAASGVR